MQQEIDLIEEYGGRYAAYEIKMKPRIKAFIPKTFSDAYPLSSSKIITMDNFHDFLSEAADGSKS